MTNISNLKINELSNVEQPNFTRVTTIGNENWEGKGQRAKMIIGKISSNAEYRIEKKFQNLLVFYISIVFQIERILKIW